MGHNSGVVVRMNEDGGVTLVHALMWCWIIGEPATGNSG